MSAEEKPKKKPRRVNTVRLSEEAEEAIDRIAEMFTKQGGLHPAGTPKKKFRASDVKRRAIYEFCKKYDPLGLIK